MRSVKSVGLAVILVAVGLPLTAAPAAASDDGATKQLPPPETAEQPIGATASVDSGGAAPAAAATTRIEAALSTRISRLDSSQHTAVEVVTNGADASSVLAALGLAPTTSIGGIALASLTPTEIRRVANASGVVQVRTPVDLRRGQLATPPAPSRGPVNGENVTYNWGTSTGRGRGVKVGIIDLFDPTLLATEISTGEIPNVPAGQKACFWLGVTCPFGTPGYLHGNGVAEVIADGAPDASLYLAEVGTLTDYRLAIDWFAANGVTIINHSSLGPFDGPGDGTGPSAAVVDYAVSKGMAWFNAAGNAGRDPDYVKFSGSYFRGLWSDPTNNRWMNFYGSDESLGAYCGALLGLRWSDWGAQRTDYDLYVSDYRYTAKTNGPKVLASGWDQSTGSPPLEGNDLRWLCNDDPADGPVYDTNGDGFVSLWVYRTTRSAAPPTGDIIEVLLNNGWVEYPTNAGSATIPFGDSKNPGAASVGALENSFYVSEYSSRGPTNDGRAKPDFSAIACLTSSVMGTGSGCFNGTSAAAPVVAALAAVGQSSLGIVKPALVMSWLRVNSRPRGATPPKNNEEGWGEPRLASEPLVSNSVGGFVPQAPTRILDTRGLNGQPVGVPIGALPPDGYTTVAIPGATGGTSVVLNVAIVNATSNGYLQVFPHRFGAPGATSNINVLAGQTRANLVVVQVGAQDAVSFYSSGGGHVIVDMVGQFAPFDAPLAKTPLVPVDPYEVYDSHTCAGCSGAPIAGGTYVDIPVAGTESPYDDDAIPTPDGMDGSRAVAISVTVSGGSGKGFLSVVQPGTTSFTTSNINFTAGESLSQTTFLPVTTQGQGKVRVYVSAAAHVRVDALGYFPWSSASTTGWFHSGAPTRVIDTRTTTKPAAGSTIQIPLATALKLPAEGSGAVFVNVTSVGATGPGSIAAGATAPLQHHVSTSIPTATAAVAAGTVATTNSDRSLSLYTSVSSNLIADVAGWFSGPDQPLTEGVTPILQNSVAGTTASGLSLSDDGSVMTYTTSAGGTISQHLWTATAGDSVLTTSTGGLGGARLSGDGTRLVLVSPDSLDPLHPSSGWQVFSYTLADGTFRLETNGAAGAFYSIDGISDDGRLILIRTALSLTAADSDLLSDAYQINLDADTTVFVSSQVPAGAVVNQASLNGAGTIAVIIAYTGSGVDYLLFRYNVAAQTTTSLPIYASAYVYPLLGDLSEDGTKLIVQGTWSSYQLNLTNNTLRRLTAAPDTSPSVPPRASMTGNGSTIVIVDSFQECLGEYPAPYGYDAVLRLPDGTFRKVNRTASGAAPTASVTAAEISDDGQWVVYVSTATNVTPTPSTGVGIYLVEVAALG